MGLPATARRKYYPERYHCLCSDVSLHQTRKETMKFSAGIWHQRVFTWYTARTFAARWDWKDQFAFNDEILAVILYNLKLNKTYGHQQHGLLRPTTGCPRMFYTQKCKILRIFITIKTIEFGILIYLSDWAVLLAFWRILNQGNRPNKTENTWHYVKRVIFCILIEVGKEGFMSYSA